MEVPMRLLTAILVLGSLLPTATLAEQANLNFGGDTYAAGQTTTIGQPVARDAFAAGYNVTLSAPVTGSAHLAGYNVSSTSSVGADLYAAGFAVTVTGQVSGDVTAMANSVVINSAAAIPGNARLAGASIVLDSAVDGSLLASAQTLTLNAPVEGDFSFYGETIAFGPNARVDGKIAIQAPKEIAVPPSVAPADRVTFQQITTPDYAGEAGKTAESIMRGVWFAVWATIVWWTLLFVVGAAFIAMSPRLVEDLTVLAKTHSFRRLGLGALSFSATIGLVLVTVLTVIGIVLLPVVVLYIFLACSLAYLAGVYFVGTRIWSAITPLQTNLQRIIALAVSLVLGGLLTMVPFLGWPITLLLLAFGFGLMAAYVVKSWQSSETKSVSDAKTVPGTSGMQPSI
jgi:hypothetical protein